MLTSEQLKNLPEDTRKEYLKTLLLLDSKKKKQEVKDEIWQDLEIHNAYFKDLYKQHKLNKKEKKNG